MPNACALRAQVVRGNSIVMMEALEKLWSEVRPASSHPSPHAPVYANRTLKGTPYDPAPLMTVHAPSHRVAPPDHASPLPGAQAVRLRRPMITSALPTAALPHSDPV
jgi:hypothetical protein